MQRQETTIDDIAPEVLQPILQHVFYNCTPNESNALNITSTYLHANANHLKRKMAVKAFLKLGQQNPTFENVTDAFTTLKHLDYFCHTFFKNRQHNNEIELIFKIAQLNYRILNYLNNEIEEFRFIFHQPQEIVDVGVMFFFRTENQFSFRQTDAHLTHVINEETSHQAKLDYLNELKSHLHYNCNPFTKLLSFFEPKETHAHRAVKISISIFSVLEKALDHACLLDGHQNESPSCVIS